MKYIDAEQLKCLLDAKYKDFIGKAKIEGYTTLQYQYMADGIDIAEQVIGSLQQEQPVLPGIEDPGIHGKDFIPVGWVDACEKYGKWKIVKVEQPEVDLEKAARHVYESWMGSTMDEVRRDMVELGTVLNARKEDKK